MQRIFRIVLFLMLGLRKVAACVASRDPEDGSNVRWRLRGQRQHAFLAIEVRESSRQNSSWLDLSNYLSDNLNRSGPEREMLREPRPVPTTTIPPRSPCQTCALPIYRNNCDGLQRSPCPSATQANVVTTGSVADCTLQFNCPPNTRAFVWPAGRNTPVAYSGTDLVCAGAPDNEWRTDMGLRVDGLSCMGPVLLPGCTFCPTAVDMYRDCSYYGRMNCYTDVSMISADVQRVGTQCR
ncbi:hypothetical protein Y032_0069g333 [Ancylostoma ceylanicum]|uniref:Uncharacterized protein n=2 Tax=Ancylostoma ceylanicum TaxID=53326 RepID=A0A016TX92_9BILA|nr:hypothetical protein Y032_0069g333 [Ancylostoma ceylanicum]